ncbi:ABC transporter permease subunit, partial [Mesorhizobium sp. M5C.F.Ca.IN.020.14.1.1]
MSPRIVFPNKILPYLLVAPQLAITLVFFYWPAGQALYQSMLRQDPFGLRTRFVWFANFGKVLADPAYLNSIKVTVVFSLATAIVAMGVALLLAVMAEKAVRGKGLYRTLLIWPYAVAPAIAGMLWLFLFNPSIGSLAYLLRSLGIAWDPLLNGTHAMILLVSAAAWKQISYNFLFFVAGLQAVPKTLIEAAAMDGAGETKRFWT